MPISSGEDAIIATFRTLPVNSYRRYDRGTMPPDGLQPIAACNVLQKRLLSNDTQPSCTTYFSLFLQALFS